MVQATNLCKSFTNGKKEVVHAVQDLSFTAHPGQVFGLLGANGAGKTTAMRLLSTLIEPTSGDASICGARVTTDPIKARANIGFLSNSAALYGRLKPVEILRYFGGLAGMEQKAMEDRIEYCMFTLRITEFADRQCDKLSTGQKQRVSVARAILHDPPVLFFDEPTAGLDVTTSQTILEFIEEAKEKNKTIIFSTHIMPEAERLCDQVLIIHQGRTQAAGTIKELMDHYQQPTFEKTFLQAVNYQREINLA